MKDGSDVQWCVVLERKNNFVTNQTPKGNMCWKFDQDVNGQKDPKSLGENKEDGRKDGNSGRAGQRWGSRWKRRTTGEVSIYQST